MCGRAAPPAGRFAGTLAARALSAARPPQRLRGRFAARRPAPCQQARAGSLVRCVSGQSFPAAISGALVCARAPSRRVFRRVGAAELLRCARSRAAEPPGSFPQKRALRRAHLLRARRRGRGCGASFSVRSFGGARRPALRRGGSAPAFWSAPRCAGALPRRGVSGAGCGALRAALRECAALGPLRPCRATRASPPLSPSVRALPRLLPPPAPVAPLRGALVCERGRRRGAGVPRAAARGGSWGSCSLRRAFPAPRGRGLRALRRGVFKGMCVCVGNR